MNKVQRNEILPLGDYEAIRPQFRARIVAEKKARRFDVGDRATVVFENHDTVLMQIQEMLRTERISREAAIQHEIDTYNELVPGPAELSATVLFSVEDKDEFQRFLAALRGVKVAVHVDGARFPGIFDDRSVDGAHSPAVLYAKFPLDDDAVTKLRKGGHAVEFAVEHPAYDVRTPLPPRTVASLAEDF